MKAGFIAMPTFHAVDGTTVVVHVFPDEPRFARDVQRVLLAVSPSAGTEADLRRMALRALRAWYPRVAIHPQDALAALVHAERLWYVFRDGQVRRPNATVDRLHRVMADARETETGAQLAMDHAAASLELARRPRPGRGATVTRERGE